MFERLTNEELKLLAGLIEEYLADLRTEIAATDDFDFRKGLKKKSEMLWAILEKLEESASAAVQ